MPIFRALMRKFVSGHLVLDQDGELTPITLLLLSSEECPEEWEATVKAGLPLVRSAKKAHGHFGSRRSMMRDELKEFLQRWIIGTVAVLVAAVILPGIHYDAWPDLLVATLLLGVLNSVLRPLLLLLSLPLLVLTLGLFTIIINAGVLYLVHLIVPGFHVEGFGWALLGAVIIGVVSVVLNSLTGAGHARLVIRRGRGRPPHSSDDGGGPVIDV